MKVCRACGRRFESSTWRCSSCGHRPPSRGRFVDLAEGEGLEGFAADSFELLSHVEETSFWFRARNELIVWALETYAPEARSFLEVGCGTGFVLRALRRRRPSLRLVGSDPYLAGLRVAARRVPEAELVILDARDLPYDCEFDAVGAFDVLEHVADDSGVLAQIRETLVPGGILLLTVPQHPWLWSAADEFAHHVRRYRRKDLLALLEETGFDVQRASSFVSLLLPAVVVSRRAADLLPGPFDPGREFELPRLLDRLFEAILGLERGLIRYGASLRFGTSLVVIARRSTVA